MADIVSPEKRSQNMSAIRSKNTKPEVYLRKLLFAQGYRYRIADKSVPGHPDIFLRKYNTAIFVNGCFWHRHPACNTHIHQRVAWNSGRKSLMIMSDGIVQ